MHKFTKFWRGLSPEQKKSFAASVDRKVPYLGHVSDGRKSASPHLAKAIEEASYGAVTRKDMRPDIWD